MERTISQSKEGIQCLKRLLYSFRQFLNSYLFYGIQLLFACFLVATRQEVVGAVIFVALISVLLIVCEDILPTTLPFLLLCTFTTNCYDSYDTFMPFAIYAPIVVMALIAHFVVYHKPFRIGESVYGICMVSIAVLLGGIGKYKIMDYIYSAYYIFGLGIGMLLAYMLMRSQFCVPRTYDLRERFAVIMTLVGVLCVFMIANGYIRKWLGLSWHIQGMRGFSPNNLATILMFALPFPLYLTKKYDWGIIGTAIFFAFICLTYSRGGLLFGTVELTICYAYWIYTAKRRKRRLIFCLLSLGLLGVCCGNVVCDVLNSRFLGDGSIIDSSRYTMIFEALDRFTKNPLIGSGILDKTIDYAENKVQGTMAWYHMMIPQIIGSMGLIGVVAYSYQFLGRSKLITKKMNSWSLVLGISYLGILMMSQVNPGEFCPLPYELLTVLLFILQERRLEWNILPLHRYKNYLAWTL